MAVRGDLVRVATSSDFKLSVVFVFLVVVALFFVFTGPHLAHLYAGLNGCKANGDCESRELDAQRVQQILPVRPSAQSLILPCFLGISGARRCCAELETGTFRLAWTKAVEKALGP